MLAFAKARVMIGKGTAWIAVSRVCRRTERRGGNRAARLADACSNSDVVSAGVVARRRSLEVVTCTTVQHPNATGGSRICAATTTTSV